MHRKGCNIEFYVYVNVIRSMSIFWRFYNSFVKISSHSKTVDQSFSVEQAFWKFSQSSKGKTWVGVFFLLKYYITLLLKYFIILKVL